jgi:hypothetical protein
MAVKPSSSTRYRNRTVAEGEWLVRAVGGLAEGDHARGADDSPERPQISGVPPGLDRPDRQRVRGRPADRRHRTGVGGGRTTLLRV